MTEIWLSNIWKSSRKSVSREPESPIIGILSFEVSRLMSKVVNLWQCLADGQIARLKEKILSSVGILKLVSVDEYYLMDLVFAEMIENVRSVAKSVAILGKKCADTKYHDLEKVFDHLGDIDPEWYGWQYRLKKIERRVKKMERFIAATEQLYQELDVLAELEQTFRRMRAGADLGHMKLYEFQPKVVWQRQEVKNLREMSPWIRTYDYIVRLLLRSLFTIVERIKYVYGINSHGVVEGNSIDDNAHSDCLVHSNSIRSLVQVSEYPYENYPIRFPVVFGRSISTLGLSDSKSKSKNKKLHHRSQSSIPCGKQQQIKARGFAPVGLAGCMTSSDSPTPRQFTSSFRGSISDDDSEKQTVTDRSIIITSPTASIFSIKHQVLNPPQSTLGHAALALHYANIIILIEKLASSPHLISLDARDDLYNMLPAAIRSCLRAKLKTFSRNSYLFFFDDEFAAKWRLAIARILEWLSPLAHNMIKWQSERNIERQRLIYGSNVLLVQTLYFANQVETEAAVVELLMGVNYLSRFSKEIHEKPFRMSSCSKSCDGYLIPRDNISYNAIDH